MRARSSVAFLVGIGSLGAAVLLRRRSAARAGYADLYLADGTRLTHGEGTPDYDRLAPLARNVLRSAG